MTPAQSTTLSRPRLWDCTEGLCWIGRDILRKRMSGYPAAVEARRMTPAAAEAGLRIAAAIAIDWCVAARLDPTTLSLSKGGDWTRAVELSPMPDFAPQSLPQISPFASSAVEKPNASQVERIEMLQAVLAHPAVAGDGDYAELVEALLWWERAADQGRIPIGQLNSINADLRAGMPLPRAA